MKNQFEIPVTFELWQVFLYINSCSKNDYSGIVWYNLRIKYKRKITRKISYLQNLIRGYAWQEGRNSIT